MDADIAVILLQDGVVNGAIYALLALSLVLVFSVTRIIFIAQGEFVAYGALTYAALDSGKVPGSVWLLCVLGLGAFAAGLWTERRGMTRRRTMLLLAETILLPTAVTVAALFLSSARLGVAAEALLTVLIVAPLGPYVYRLAFQPMAEASVLVLLIASVGVHLALLGIGLVLFGPEGSRANGFSNGVFTAGPILIPGQTLWVLSITVASISGLFAFFRYTLFGTALRATAVNRLGARLVGIATSLSGRAAFTVAGLMGAMSGILVVPLTTLYYDSGFLIGLKGFVAAIIGGLVSYPAAALAAIVVGTVESFSSFYASAFKEVIVFTIIIPVLLWRALATPPVEDEE